MGSKDEDRLKGIRKLVAAVKQREVDERVELGDADVLAVIDKMLKQRRESINQFEQGGRPDLAAAERAEVTVLQAYMPQPYSAEEIERLVSAAIEQVSAAGPKDIGAVMAVLRPQLAGRADMGAVSQQVKTRLGGSR
jgi:uncharacterized protein YqeY